MGGGRGDSSLREAMCDYLRHLNGHCAPVDAKLKVVCYIK